MFTDIFIIIVFLPLHSTALQNKMDDENHPSVNVDECVENHKSEESDATNSDNEQESGKYVRRIKTSSESEDSNRDEPDDNNLKQRYEALLAKFQKERRKKKIERSKPNVSGKQSLAEKIRGWQAIDLEKLTDHKEQYHSWLAFKSTMEANWQMYNIHRDEDKLICLRTKCKGFIAQLINSLQRSQPNFKEVWSGLQNHFYAPINSGEETAAFYQIKQQESENIFTFFERVAKQAYLCDFVESEYNKRIGETFSRNCLNPAFFLGVFGNFDDLEQLKQHARNFHAALPKVSRAEPVLALKSSFESHSGRTESKRTSGYNVSDPKRRRFNEPRDQLRGYWPKSCKYCAGDRCSGRNCPARGKRCSYCQRLDHFERACLRKKADERDKYDVSVNAMKDEDEQKVNPDE